MLQKVLVSACLLGRPVRYDGRSAQVQSRILEWWQAEGRIVAVCPEVEGGLPTPRAPAEIVGGGGGDVLSGSALLRHAGDASGGAAVPLTDAFLRGAARAWEVARREGIGVAVLKERSPSCGSQWIYDGTFSGTLVPGEGVTAALLRQHGVRVFSEAELEEADRVISERGRRR